MRAMTEGGRGMEIKTDAGVLGREVGVGDSILRLPETPHPPRHPPPQSSRGELHAGNMSTFWEGSSCTWAWAGVLETEPRGLCL